MLFVFIAAVNHEHAAFSSYGMLTISFKYPVKVLIDGRSYNERINGSNEVILRNIQPGYHTIKIYRQKNNGYETRRIPGSQQLIYNGNIYIKAQYHVDITINRFGKAFTDERRMGQGYEYDQENNPEGNPDGQYEQAMNAASFSQFKQSVTNGNYDDTKLAIAKQTISGNFFTASQISEILQLFNYEGSKLEIAKYAYSKCVDKNNYFTVSNSLTYSSSKEELAKFLQTAL